jgi:hypothetical protein
MATSNILELRQADSIVNKNGDYQTLLSNDITLNNGDILALKNAFIDTKQTGNIILESDTTLTIQFCPYITDWYQTTDKEDYVLNNNEPTSIDNANCMDFIPYYNTVDGPLQGYELVETVNYEYLQAPGDLPPSIQTTYSYINILNQTIVFHTSIAFDKLPPAGFGPYEDILTNIVAKIGSFQLLTTKDTLDIYGLSYRTPPITVVTNPLQTTYDPYIFSTSIVVPAGNYSPTYLSLYISEKLTQNGPNNSTTQPFICESPFIKPSFLYDEGQNMPNGATGATGNPIVIAAQTKFISTNGYLAFNFVPETSYYVGSSQIALEFDTDSNKFVFQFLHFPMYDNVAGTNISVRYAYYNNNPAERITATAKNGGIFLTGLLATDANGNAIDFWTNTLGFDLSKICINANNGYVEDVLGLTGFVQTIGPIIHGQNATTGFFGLDSVVIKKETDFFKMPVLTNFDDDVLCSTINNTIAIEASFSIDDLLNKYSHFLIQVDFTLSNNYIGTETYRNISGIISKYYSDANYTFDSGEGAIQYVHNGLPVQIKSVRVRILSSDKTIDPLLGSDNTVIFNIIKQAQAQVKKA